MYSFKKPREPENCKGCGTPLPLIRAYNTHICATCKKGPNPTGAHWMVHYAIRYGYMRPASEFPCVDCGGPSTEYDHRDYNKPLEVEPVCSPCNKARGPAIPRTKP